MNQQPLNVSSILGDIEKDKNIEYTGKEWERFKEDQFIKKFSPKKPEQLKQEEPQHERD